MQLKDEGKPMVQHTKVQCLYVHLMPTQESQDKAFFHVFTKEKGWLWPMVDDLMFGRTSGTCGGFILHQSILLHCDVWSHGTWATPPSTSFLQLQSLQLPTGFRVRSDAAKQRRRNKLARKRRHGSCCRLSRRSFARNSNISTMGLCRVLSCTPA